MHLTSQGYLSYRVIQILLLFQLKKFNVKKCFSSTFYVNWRPWAFLWTTILMFRSSWSWTFRKTLFCVTCMFRVTAIYK